MGNINRTHYHELDLLLWDMHKKFIEPKTAFELYEKRWGYVNKEKLTSKEQNLIRVLTERFGQGLFMPATY